MALKVNLRDMETFFENEFYINGQQVIDRVKQLVEESLS